MTKPEISEKTTEAEQCSPRMGQIPINPNNLIEGTTAILLLLVRALVDEPKLVMVNPITGLQSVIYEISVEREDVRRIIGRKGRTAEALREILHNLGAKAGKRFSLDIVEPG